MSSHCDGRAAQPAGMDRRAKTLSYFLTGPQGGSTKTGLVAAYALAPGHTGLRLPDPCTSKK